MNPTLLLGALLCFFHLGETFKKTGDTCCDKVQLTSTDTAFLASKFKFLLGSYSLYTSNPSLNDRKVYKRDSTDYCLYWSRGVWRINYCPYIGTGNLAIHMKSSDTDNKCPYGGDLVWTWYKYQDPTMKVSCTAGPLMAIDGFTSEVLNTSCIFPLRERRKAPISVTTADGKTLVCGGASPRNGGSPKICWQFDYRYNFWRKLTNYRLSEERVTASAVSLSKGVYVLGGSKQSSKTSEFLATGSSQWTQGPDIPGSGVFQSCAAKLNDTAFVVLGGWYDGHQAWVYNEETGNWTNWPNLRESVSRQSCVALGDKLLMAGGYGRQTRRYTEKTVVFDSKNGQTIEVGSLNGPRGLAGITVIGGKAVILGGYNGHSLLLDGEEFDMETNKWKPAPYISLKYPQNYVSLVNLVREVECN